MKNKQNIKNYLLILMLAIFFNMIFSYSFNIMYGNTMGSILFLPHDSQLFYHFGKMAANNTLPYVDFWDHKGVLLFDLFSIPFHIPLIPEGLSCAIFSILLVSVNSIMFYELFNEFTKKTANSLQVLFIVLLTQLTSVGGYACELLLCPFISLMTLLTLKYNENFKQNKNSNFIALLIGVLLSIIFNIRVKEVVFGLVPLTTLIYNEICKNKDFKTFFKYALIGFTGFIVSTLLIILPFILTNTFSDWLFGNITFSLTYSNNYSLLSKIKILFSLDNYEFPIILLIALTCLYLCKNVYENIKIKKVNIDEIFLYSYSIAGIVNFILGVPTSHYAMALVPVVVIATTWTINQFKSYLQKIKSKDKLPFKSQIFPLLLFSLLTFAFMDLMATTSYTTIKFANDFAIPIKQYKYEHPDVNIYDATEQIKKELVEDVHKIIKDYDPNATQDEIFFADCQGNLYTQENVMLDKYVSYHSWWSQYDTKVREDIKDQLHKYKYVVWGGKASNMKKFLKNTVEEKYGKLKTIYEEEEFFITVKDGD